MHGLAAHADHSEERAAGFEAFLGAGQWSSWDADDAHISGHLIEHKGKLAIGSDGNE